MIVEQLFYSAHLERQYGHAIYVQYETPSTPTARLWPDPEIFSQHAQGFIKVGVLSGRIVRGLGGALYAEVVQLSHAQQVHILAHLASLKTWKERNQEAKDENLSDAAREAICALAEVEDNLDDEEREVARNLTERLSKGFLQIDNAPFGVGACHDTQAVQANSRMIWMDRSTFASTPKGNPFFDEANVRLNILALNKVSR